VAQQVNRNKKSVGVSFAHERGVGILHGLAARCDVLVENYLPGGLRKYNLDYEAVRKINPGIIYASITGYGQTGPYSSRAGYDVMVEAYVYRKPRHGLTLAERWGSCT
jgi:succinate--hydroxymethylglutarate CoA-transferase